jgi:hypothetical protein
MVLEVRLPVEILTPPEELEETEQAQEVETLLTVASEEITLHQVQCTETVVQPQVGAVVVL